LGLRYIHKRYNIENTKIINFPFDSLNLFDKTLSKNKNKSSVIGDSKYFIYPASFWPHKNHTKLIKAFGKFTEKNRGFKLVYLSFKFNFIYYLFIFLKQKWPQEVNIFYLFESCKNKLI
jgi:hypothetical protein